MNAIKASVLLFCFVFLFCYGDAFGFDDTACAQRQCSGPGCSSMFPAHACLSGMPPGGECVCYTDFVIQFRQQVRLTVNVLDTSCGNGSSFLFILKNTSDVPIIQETMTGPGLASKTIWLDPNTYRILEDRVGQPGGNYCVEYWSGPPNCNALISMANTNFGDIDVGECSGWRNITFTNDGNCQFTGISIASGDPAFQLDLTGVPATLDPEGHFTFKVKFCPGSGLADGTHLNPNITVNYTCNGGSNSKNKAVSGTAHVPTGHLSVPAVFDVGSADWSVAPYFVERNLNINNSGDAPMSVTAMITNNGGGVFTLPSGGNVGSISGPGNRNLLIRATVASETTYTGQLQVTANYSGGTSDTQNIELQARGHHPVPILTILNNEINYREVEIDYSFHQSLGIANDGDAPLSFTIGLQDPADADLSQFTLDTGSKNIPVSASLPPHEVRYYQMTFHPSDTGSKEIFLLVHNANDATFTSATVRLYGSGITPVPLSTMMVLDRSLSMDGMAGDTRKIEALRDAGVLYSELARDAWDWLGVTKYNNTYSTPVNLASIASNRAAVQALCNDISGELLPAGATSIGGGMETAAADYGLAPAINAKSMIVFTDGKENTEPMIAGVKTTIINNHPTLKIFCVGIGNDLTTDPYAIEGINVPAMQDLSEPTGGICRVFQSISGENRYALEAFYFKSFAIATGRQMALDPIYYVPLATMLQEVSNVAIVSCDRDADFLVISELFKLSGMALQIYLQSPSGQIMEAGAAVGGIPVHVKRWGNCMLVRVKFPPRDQSDEYCGNWKVFLKPVSTGDIRKMLTNMAAKTGGTVPIAFMASVGSDYRLEVSVTGGEVLVGQPLQIAAKTTEAWWPIPGAKISVTVTKPNGVKLVKDLFDDGLHGDGDNNDATFGLAFSETNIRGNYEFLFRSLGKTERGEDVVREAFLTKYIGSRTPETPRPCIPCWLLRLILFLITLLLLFILFVLIRCCYRKRMG